MLRRNIYRWHRITSLVIAILVLLWAASGFMHPLMTNVRPKMATQVLVPSPVDSTQLKVSLQDALLQNKIPVIHNFRLVPPRIALPLPWITNGLYLIKYSDCFIPGSG